jgi:hypothetical protein
MPALLARGGGAAVKQIAMILGIFGLSLFIPGESAPNLTRELAILRPKPPTGLNFATHKARRSVGSIVMPSSGSVGPACKVVDVVSLPSEGRVQHALAALRRV